MRRMQVGKTDDSMHSPSQLIRRAAPLADLADSRTIVPQASSPHNWPFGRWRATGRGHYNAPMSKSRHVSETPATQFLRRHGIAFGEHPYDYVEHGGTEESARQLGVDEHHVVKTLVMEDEHAKPLIVLMHGDCTVSTKNLARQIGAKRVEPCKPEVANRHSGYLIGGTSPFGTRKTMPVYVESSILELDRIWINGGRRGFLVSIVPSVVTSFLNAQPVQCASVE
jgi:Cys-tRNA(Pro) deacylase